MAEIKSALELALEKAERYGKASPQEMQEVKWQEQARSSGGRIFAGKNRSGTGIEKSSPPKPRLP